MCKFLGKSNERILCKLSKSEILGLYSIVHVAMETTKTSHFTCQSKSFISIFFTCQVSTCELQPFSCHYLANEIYSQTAKTVFSHLNSNEMTIVRCSFLVEVALAACLRQTSKFHHQASFWNCQVAKFCMHKYIPKAVVLNGITKHNKCKCKELFFQMRRGEICSYDVIMHKDHLPLN